MIAPYDPAEPDLADDALHEDVLDYTPRPKSVALARNRAARLVGEWGHPQLADDTRLLVSELATNALLHGAVRGRLFRVRLVLTACVLRIEVTDARGERLPCQRDGAGAPEATGGRGLLLVGTLSARWGVRLPGVGKTVWCEVALRPAVRAVRDGPDAHSLG
ncbi:ATP-binding protein [Streptomyces sp. NPDC101393]|uniref:ATP-binding protein n=1 Tax=Streptomyces sp. NPDC101393 TaxID=3366141 RepID=UPI0038091D41